MTAGLVGPLLDAVAVRAAVCGLALMIGCGLANAQGRGIGISCDPVTRPEVVTEYRGYTPRSDVTRSVRALLDAVPPSLLVSLHEVVLTNTLAPSRSARRRRVWSRGIKRQAADALALYHPGSKVRPPRIELYVDRLLSGVPTPIQRIGLVRELLFAKVLYHEIGHHIQSRVQPQFGEIEDIADQWAMRLIRVLVTKRYSYIVPMLRILGAIRRTRHP